MNLLTYKRRKTYYTGVMAFEWFKYIAATFTVPNELRDFVHQPMKLQQYLTTLAIKKYKLLEL